MLQFLQISGVSAGLVYPNQYPGKRVVIDVPPPVRGRFIADEEDGRVADNRKTFPAGDLMLPFCRQRRQAKDKKDESHICRVLCFGFF